MATMQQVLNFFRGETGLDFYPNPAELDEAGKALVERVDAIIAKQAEHLSQDGKPKCAHVTAQQRGDEVLGLEAQALFDELLVERIEV